MTTAIFISLLNEMLNYVHVQCQQVFKGAADLSKHDDVTTIGPAMSQLNEMRQFPCKAVCFHFM